MSLDPFYEFGHPLIDLKRDFLFKKFKKISKIFSYVSNFLENLAIYKSAIQVEILCFYVISSHLKLYNMSSDTLYF